MNPLRRYRGNPGFFEDPNNHGDLWAAIHECYTRMAVLDERIRVALTFVLPILTFLVAMQLVLLGVSLK